MHTYVAKEIVLIDSINGADQIILEITVRIAANSIFKVFLEVRQHVVVK